MATLLSDYLGVSSAALTKQSVVDPVLGVDSRLFVDPFLLKKTKIPELKDSRDKVREYFRKILVFIKVSKAEGDRPYRAAFQSLIFRELRGVSIGYGTHSSDGNAIGPVLARRLLKSAIEIHKLGVDEPEIFELLGLFEEDFGVDRLSDMTIRIVCDDLMRFTSRVTKALNIAKTKTFEVGGKQLVLPAHPNGKDPLIFVPKDILRDLPIAHSPDQIEQVVAVNEALRKRINALIGREWKKTTRLKKKQLRAVMSNDKTSLEQLVKAYRSSDGEAYDVSKDPHGLLSWYRDGKDSAEADTLELALPASPNELDPFPWTV